MDLALFGKGETWSYTKNVRMIKTAKNSTFSRYVFSQTIYIKDVWKGSK